MLGQTTAVLFVLLLFAAALWFLRRKGLATMNFGVTNRLARPRIMQVIERVPLTPQHSLHLVKIHDHMLVIGVSPAGCSQIEALPCSALGTFSGDAP